MVSNHHSASWRLVRLRDVVKIGSRNVNPADEPDKLWNLVGLENVEQGTGKLVDFAPVPGRQIRSVKVRFEKGDILYGKLRPYLRKAWVAEFDGCSSTDLIPLTPGPEINAEYLKWFLLSPLHMEYVAPLMAGIRMPRLRTDDLYNMPIPLPPLDEQRRIVTRIDEMMERIRRVRVMVRESADLARRLVQVIYRRFFAVKTDVPGADVSAVTANEYVETLVARRQQRWTELGRKGTCPMPRAMPRADLPPLPQGWCWATIDQLCFVGTGATPKRTEPRYWENGTIAWVTSGMVNLGKVTQPSEYVTEAALYETNLTLYQPGTILMAMYGEGRTRGMCAELAVSSTTNQAVAAMELIDNSPEMRSYLLHFFRARYEENRRMAAGGVQPNLSLSLIRRIAVPLPPPTILPAIVTALDQQVRVADEFVSISESVLADLDELERAVLSAGFEAPSNTRPTRLASPTRGTSSDPKRTSGLHPYKD